MCIVHKGFRGFRAVSPASILAGNLISLKPTIPYDTIHSPFSRHRLRLVGRTDGGLHPAFYSSPNGDIVEHRICEITRDSGYPPPATSQILRPLYAIIN
ncbi:hypothetical protein SAMN05216364_10427 [Porphyromonadaceae bacterium KHP3R9]|nr:hypothetical protein SAMN05216364_10427 [Porphyromonadaceae bacterium KHP3R9]